MQVSVLKVDQTRLAVIVLSAKKFEDGWKESKQTCYKRYFGRIFMSVRDYALRKALLLARGNGYEARQRYLLYVFVRYFGG